MHSTSIVCPLVGHKAFERAAATITLGDVDTPQQISKIIRPASCTDDGMGLVFRVGELQKVDIERICPQFEYPHFIEKVIREHQGVFATSDCRIYQFQVPTAGHGHFVFGLFITDGSHNLVDFCVESPAHKRRPVLVKLMRAICTPASVSRKLNH